MVNFYCKDQVQNYLFGSLWGWFEYQHQPLHLFLKPFPCINFIFLDITLHCNTCNKSATPWPSHSSHCSPTHITSLYLSMTPPFLPADQWWLQSKHTKQAEPLNLDSAIRGLRLFGLWGNSKAAGSRTNIKSLKTMKQFTDRSRMTGFHWNVYYCYYVVTTTVLLLICSVLLHTWLCPAAGSLEVQFWDPTCSSCLLLKLAVASVSWS